MIASVGTNFHHTYVNKKSCIWMNSISDLTFDQDGLMADYHYMIYNCLITIDGQNNPKLQGHQQDIKNIVKKQTLYMQKCNRFIQ